jgi:hypothetical protein
VRQRGTNRVIGAQVVHVEQPLHLRGRNRVDRAVDAEAGIAHHHVESPEAVERRRDERLHVLRAGDVANKGQGASAGPLTSAAVCSSGSRRRAHKTREAPWPARRMAVARPIPAEAPVIAMILSMKGLTVSETWNQSSGGWTRVGIARPSRRDRKPWA